MDREISKTGLQKDSAVSLNIMKKLCEDKTALLHGLAHRYKSLDRHGCDIMDGASDIERMEP